MHAHEWIATFPTRGGPWKAEGDYRCAVARAAAQLEPIRLLGPMRESDLPLFVLVKDEALLLPSFLDHYRRLGVDRFVAIDNNSRDASPEILTDAPDVDLWLAEGSFSEACAGRLWVDALALTSATGRWAVFVDADEFLVFPDMERLGLRGLALQLERVGETRLLAPLVDVYGRGPIEATRLTAGSDPMQMPFWFDTDGYLFRRRATGTHIFGGPRRRLFAKDASVTTFTLSKHPFERCDLLTLRPSPHYPFPFERNPPLARAALIHLKLISDLPRRVEAALQSEQYWRGSSEYRLYQDALSSEAGLSAWTPTSRPYRGPDDLVSIGLITPPTAARREPPTVPERAPEDILIDAPPQLKRRFRTVGHFQRTADRAAQQLTRVSGPVAADAPVTLLSVVRNEVALLPAFLNHYRALGVRRFIVVDNGSTDGTRELLEASDDVELYVTDSSYAASVHGRLWIDGLARSEAMDRWIIHVDADELLVYDGMLSHGIEDLIGWMSGKGLRRLYAPMLDLHPEDLAAARTFQGGEQPLSIPHFFDRLGYEIRLTDRGPMLYGGARCRIFSPDKRLMMEAAKHPLTWWDRSCAHVSNHTPMPYQWNGRAPYAALLHFKFLGDLRSRTEVLIEEQQHWNRAWTYKQVLDGLADMQDSPLLCAHSVAYEGPLSLIKTGMMLPIDWEAES